MKTDNQKGSLKPGLKNWTERRFFPSLGQGFRGWKLARNLWIFFSIPFVGFSLWKTVEDNFYLRGIREGSKRGRRSDLS